VSEETIQLVQLTNWMKTNLILPIHRNVLKYIVETINHEYLHSQIYNFFNIKNHLVLQLKASRNSELWIFGLCHAEYKKIDLKLIFVEFVQTFFDIIHDIFNFNNFLFRIPFFLRKILGKFKSECEES